VHSRATPLQLAIEPRSCTLDPRQTLFAIDFDANKISIHILATATSSKLSFPSHDTSDKRHNLIITSLFSSLAFEMLSHPKDTNLLDYGRVAINRDWFHVLVHL
jgi:hypothetical protein